MWSLESSDWMILVIEENGAVDPGNYAGNNIKYHSGPEKTS